MAFNFGNSQPAASSATSAGLFGAATGTTSGGLFGSTPAKTPSTGGLFGSAASTAQPAASTTGGLFGSTTTAAPAAGGLFGSTTAAPSTTGGLFGSTTAPAPALSLGTSTTPAQPAVTSTPAAIKTTTPLFGSPANATIAASSTGLFGAATGTTGGGLFSSTPAKTPSTGDLFGSATSTTQPAASTAGGLFGSTTTAAGGLFGSTTAAPSTTGGLFGSTTAPAPALSLGTSTTPAAPIGLGGSSGTGSLNLGGAGTTLGAGATEKENIREGEVPAPIMELLKIVQEKAKQNKDMAEEFQKLSCDGVKMIKYKLKEVNHLIAEENSAATARDAKAAALSAKVTKDYRLGKEAQAIQESLNRSQHSSVAQQHAMQHIIELIKEYDVQVTYYQEIIEQMTIRIRDILQGQGKLTTAELKEYLTRFDTIFSSVANKLFEANSKVEELRSTLTSEDQLRIREPQKVQQNWIQARGPSAFPSQAVLTHLGAMLKPATGTTTTGTGLFGSTGTTGGSLFGSTTANKPLFGSTTAPIGGSLFAPSNTTSTTQPTSSLFPPLSSTPAKPATSFGSTLSTNTSGLLFSSKK